MLTINDVNAFYVPMLRERKNQTLFYPQLSFLNSDCIYRISSYVFIILRIQALMKFTSPQKSK